MEANLYKAPAARVEDLPATASEITWGRATKVWWSLAWRGLLFGTLGGGAAGFLVGVVGALLGWDRQLLPRLGNIAGLIVAIPIGIWVVRNVLRKTWSDFRIALLPKQ